MKSKAARGLEIETEAGDFPFITEGMRLRKSFLVTRWPPNVDFSFRGWMFGEHRSSSRTSLKCQKSSVGISPWRRLEGAIICIQYSQPAR